MTDARAGEESVEHTIAAIAKACYDKAISSRTDSIDPFYRRGVAEVELGDFAAAVPDLERAVSSDLDYDFHRAKGLLGWAYAQTGQNDSGRLGPRLTDNTTRAQGALLDHRAKKSVARLVKARPESE